MRKWKVGIVGGGPGGLITAYELQKMADCALELTLFEASDRLGGKILSPHFQAASVRYEAGAAEIYDYSRVEEDPLRDLIEELGLPICPMGGSAVIMNHRILSNLDDIHDHFGPQACGALQHFDRLAKDRISPKEFYHWDNQHESHQDTDHHRFDGLLARIAHPETRQYIENLIHSDLATEPDQTSPSYGLQNYVMNDPSYMHLYGIDGGNERLPRELAARIEAKFLMKHPVRSVGKTGDSRLRVCSVHQGQARQDDFDVVVVALPHNQLASVSFEGTRLNDAMQRHSEQYDFPAHYLRVTILFEKPFWRNSLSDSYWMLDRFGGCCLYDESSRDPSHNHGILGWLLGGAAAREMCQWSDEQLIAEALGSLPNFLAHGRQYFVEGQVHRWERAVNAIPGGTVPVSLDRRHQPEPTEHPRLFIVGDYLFDSTLNGVRDSAEYVAAWIAALTADNLEVHS